MPNLFANKIKKRTSSQIKGTWQTFDAGKIWQYFDKLGVGNGLFIWPVLKEMLRWDILNRLVQLPLKTSQLSYKTDLFRKRYL